MKNKLFLIIIFISLSCSDYRKLFKTEGYEEKLEGALKYYEQEEYYPERRGSNVIGVTQEDA